eukprot:SM003223S12607  [mRNA]  locus=s3223:815:1454:- [translate_table: standard]
MTQPPGLRPLAGGRLYLLVFLAAASLASAAVTDVYGPICPDFPLSDPPPGAGYTERPTGRRHHQAAAFLLTGWLLWSSPSTWPGGTVPGGSLAIGADATLPCGTGVILDVPVLVLGLLDIHGWLKCGPWSH